MQIKRLSGIYAKFFPAKTCAKINIKFAKTANFRAILHMADCAHRKVKHMEGKMSTLPITHLDRIVMNTTPVLHGALVQKLRQVLVNRMMRARMNRSQRQIIEQLSVSQLHDVGLERVFDGQNWKLQMIDAGNNTARVTTFGETTQGRR
ncbi:hypothetical protein TH25_19535 [Thalassospira profundimaris]|uniref:Uncharacterized protein n=2 Tax=Thalassospira profundimaris TaxID=502049 RepID=A0A367WSN4_9PROT|nr:hypothetical protein TH25_19535 [Thalassospira profundimaris]